MEPNVWTTGLIVAVMLTGCLVCADFDKTVMERLQGGCEKACPRNCSAENLQNCSSVEEYQRCVTSCLRVDQCKDVRLIIEHYAAGYYLKGLYGCPDHEIYELGEAGAKLKAEDPDCGTGIVSCQKPAISYLHKKQATNEAISKEEFCTFGKKEADCESELIQCKCGNYKAYLGYLYSTGHEGIYGTICDDAGKVTPEAVNTCAGGTGSNAVAVTARMPVLLTSLAMIPLHLLLVR